MLGFARFAECYSPTAAQANRRKSGLPARGPLADRAKTVPNTGQNTVIADH